jgi:hypothetical protein
MDHTRGIYRGAIVKENFRLERLKASHSNAKINLNMKIEILKKILDKIKPGRKSRLMFSLRREE